MKTEPATPSAKDTNSPVCNYLEEDANKLEMLSKETMKEYYEVGCWAGNAQVTIHKLLIHVAKVQAKLEASEAQNAKMREALRYYAQESNQNEDGLYVLSHDGWFDGTEHDGSEYIVPFDNGTTAQKAISSLPPYDRTSYTIGERYKLPSW